MGCDSWGRKESDTTELKWTEDNSNVIFLTANFSHLHLLYFFPPVNLARNLPIFINLSESQLLVLVVLYIFSDSNLYLL